MVENQVISDLELATTTEIFRELSNRFPAVVMVYLDDRGPQVMKHLLFSGSDVAAYGLCAYGQHFLTHASQRVQYDVNDA